MRNGGRQLFLREGLGVLLSLALAAGGLYVAGILKAGDWSNLPSAIGGSASYFEYGQQWARGDGPLLNGRPPVYPFLMGLCYRLESLGDPIHLLLAVQCVLSLIILMGCYAWVRWRSGSVVAGLGAVALLVANLSMLREFLTGRETVVFGFIVLATFTLFSFPGAMGIRRSLALGLLCALAWLTRPTGFALVLTAGFFLIRTGARLSPRHALKLAAAFILGIVLPVGLWMGYQLSTGQQPRIAGGNALYNLYLGNNEIFAAAYPLIDVDVMHPHVQNEIQSWEIQGRSSTALMARETVGFWIDRPFEGIRLSVIKALAFLTPRYFPRGSGRLVETPEGWVIEDYAPVPVLHDLLSFAALPGVILLGFSLYRWKHLTLDIRFACVTVLMITALHILSFAESRFRQPLDPILAVSGMVVVVGALRARQRQPEASELQTPSPVFNLQTVRSYSPVGGRSGLLARLGGAMALIRHSLRMQDKTGTSPKRRTSTNRYHA